VWFYRGLRDQSSPRSHVASFVQILAYSSRVPPFSTLIKYKSPQPDSNWRPLPYQGSALPTELYGQSFNQRVMGIEPTLSAWKAEVLPLNYTRVASCDCIRWRGKDSNLRRRKPSDLQSDPFGRSGTPPLKSSENFA
jgi:hypothetical protein